MFNRKCSINYVDAHKVITNKRILLYIKRFFSFLIIAEIIYCIFFMIGYLL